MTAKRTTVSAGGEVIGEYEAAVPAESLTPHPENPREGDIGAIHELIRVNGFYGALVVQRSTGFILAGNHRYQAATALGINALPVIWLDVDDVAARRILLSDNRASDLASNNLDALVTALRELLQETGTLDGTGYEEDDLADLFKALDGGDHGPGDTEISGLSIEWEEAADGDAIRKLLGLRPGQGKVGAGKVLARARKKGWIE